MNKLCTIIVTHHNKPNNFIDGLLPYISDKWNANFLVVDNGSTQNNFIKLYSNLAKSGISFVLVQRENIGMDHGGYWFGIQRLLNNDIEEFDIKTNMSKVKNKLFDTDIIWLMQEHLDEHAIIVTAARGWHRSYSDRISLEHCKKYLDENPRDQIGVFPSSKDERIGYTIWNPGRCQGRDIDKETKGQVDHNYWNLKFGLGDVNCAGGFICKKKDEMIRIFSDVEITEEELKRPGFAWEAERFMTFQLTEKYGGHHINYWDLFYNEGFEKSWFSENLIKRVWDEQLFIPTPVFNNEILYKLYGRNKEDIRAKWNDKEIIEMLQKYYNNLKWNNIILC